MREYKKKCEFLELNQTISFDLEETQAKCKFRGNSFAFMGLALSACGSGGGGDTQSTGTQATGYPSNYEPPTPTAPNTTGSDQFANTLNVNYASPYWVEALSMDRGESLISTLLDAHGDEILFAFPEAKPSYDMEDIIGWGPASEPMKVATREIVAKLNERLGINFTEATDVEAKNVLAVGVSNQSNTSGFAYFPNPDFSIGSDVFISNNYKSPSWLTETRTNYDYEVLVHEIGHALGLKHPFDRDGTNTTTLNGYEDQTRFTTMSYDDAPSTFDGTFRPLDWMTLTKFYGVDSSYKPGDDTYSFSGSAGTFIIDGAGIDTIDASASTNTVSIDLRPGMQSWLGSKSTYVTSANQMTISHGTVIENIVTGSGGDTAIGNEFANSISTRAGDDIIYAGEGPDVIDAGAGQNQIDLSEVTQALDTLVYDASSLGEFADTVYGFAQGLLGDALDLSGLITTLGKFLPLVSTQNVPVGLVDSCVVRLIGSEIASAADLSTALYDGGPLENLKLSEKASAVFVVATNQDTGVTQNLYHASFDGTNYSSTHLARFIGDFMDIDSWTANNFEAPSATLIA